MMALPYLYLLVLVFWFPAQAKECDLRSPVKIFKPKLARHFYIEYFTKFKIVHVDESQYFLSENAQLDCTTSMVIINTPVKRAVMMSTTYLPALESIEMSKSLIGFQGIHNIVSSAFDSNKIQEVSFKFNTEELLNLKADLIMGYEANFSSAKQVQVFNSLHLPVVINKDFQETSPLARAEWIIFISSFYNQEEKARKIFNYIGSEYTALKSINSKLKPESRPKVLIGDIQNGYWVTSGGRSDLAQLIADAGAEMLLARPSSSTQRISLEELSQMKNSVDFWLPHNGWENHNELLAAFEKDSRYQLISARITPGNIYNNNLMTNKNKANDYWETGMQRPDLLLLDFSAIFHPKEFKNHKFQWYQKL